MNDRERDPLALTLWIAGSREAWSGRDHPPERQWKNLIKGELNIRLCFNNTSIKNKKWIEDHLSVRGELTSWHFSLWRGRWATVTGAENGYGASSQWRQPHWDEGLGPIKCCLRLPDGLRVRQQWDLWSENRCIVSHSPMKIVYWQKLRKMKGGKWQNIWNSRFHRWRNIKSTNRSMSILRHKSKNQKNWEKQQNQPNLGT